MDLAEVQAMLTDYDPELHIKAWPNGMYTVEQYVYRIEVLGPEEDPILAYRERGLQEVFRIKNRIPGRWVLDEMRRRDPRMADREGNLYHEAWKTSLDAAMDTVRDRDAHRQNAMESWEIAKRNPALMERFSRRLMSGDKNAWREFSPETMAHHAALENPRELRRQSFWRSI